MARRDTVAALAGLAALTALMGRKGKDREVPVEDRTITPVRRDQPDITPEYVASLDVPTEPGIGASSAAAAPATTTKPTTVSKPKPTVKAATARGASVDAATARRLDNLAALRKYEQQKEDERLAARQKRMETPNVDAIEPDLDVLNPIPIPGLGRMRQAAKALQTRKTGSVVPYEQPVTFVGRSGPRNITPPERLGQSSTAIPQRAELLERPGVVKQRGLDAARADRAARRQAEMEAENAAAAKSAAARARAEAMEEAKPILQARPGKASPRARSSFDEDMAGVEFKKGGKAKKMAKGGVTRSSASSRADGIAKRGKTRGRLY